MAERGRAELEFRWMGKIGNRGIGEGENRFRSQGNGITNILVPKRSRHKGENHLKQMCEKLRFTNGNNSVQKADES